MVKISITLKNNFLLQNLCHSLPENKRHPVSIYCGCCCLFQSEDSEIDVDEDDEEGEEEEEEEESKDLEDDSLDGSLSKSNRPSRGGGRPPLLEESDDDF